VVRHEQVAELLDARMVCLVRARTEIRRWCRSCPMADAAALEPRRLRRREGRRHKPMRQPQRLARRRAAPTDPDQVREVDRLRGEVAHLEALRLLGKVQAGLAAGLQTIERARAVGYAPLLADALDKTTWFEVTAGHDDAAIEHGYETARVGAEAHDDSLVASGLIRVGYVLGFDKQRFEAAEVAFQSAVAAATRAGNPGQILERLYGDWATVRRGQQRRLTLAVLAALCQVVLGLSVRLYGAESYQAAFSLSEPRRRDRPPRPPRRGRRDLPARPPHRRAGAVDPSTRPCSPSTPMPGSTCSAPSSSTPPPPSCNVT